MKAGSELFSLGVTTSELLPDSPLFSPDFLSAYSDIVGERAKRARYSQVCTIENRGYWYMQFQFIARACHTQRALLQR